MLVSMSAAGLSELIGALLGSAARVVPASAVAVGKSANVMADHQRVNVPVYEGETRDSIGVDHEGLSATAGPTTRWAPFVEYGTYKDDPQPFVGPSGEAGADDLEQTMLLVGLAL